MEEDDDDEDNELYLFIMTFLLKGYRSTGQSSVLLLILCSGVS